MDEQPFRPALSPPAPMIARPGSPPMTPELSAVVEECMAATYPGDDGGALSRPAEGLGDPEPLAWAWLNEQQECSPADIDYSADQMVDAFMAGRASRDRTDAFRAALEKIAADGEPYRNGYCQADIAVDPALTAHEAQDVARSALMATPTPAPAETFEGFNLSNIKRTDAPAVDWNVVGPKLVEAAKAVTMAAWTDRHSRLHGHPTITALDAALAAAQTQSNGE